MTPGSSAEPQGVTLAGGGANVAIYATADRVEICTFVGGVETRTALPEHTGDVHHGFVAGITQGTLYGLRAHGPANPAKLLIDPHARALDQDIRLHAAMRDYGEWASLDSAPLVPRCVAGAALAPAADTRPCVPWERMIVQEVHVRGWSMRHPAVPQEARGTFAGLGHPASIDYLRNLGITTVEVLPAMAWIDERHLPPLGLRNYWGYNPVAMLAPQRLLAPGGMAEIRDCVAALHAAGIELILDVVLNHSGESDELGPTLCLRGLARGYYRQKPGDDAHYVNDTGCGNTLALDRPQPLRLAMDALRHWAAATNLDGFRFDLAPVLGRREAGFDPAAPLLAAIDQDPLLRELKMIAEPWDIGAGGYQLGQFPPRWGEWNDRFRDDVRQFWRGDRGAGALATRIAGSADMLSRKGARPSRGVNFVAAHDGFTLADLVAYAGKHNHANGEQNRDGTDDNHSWNNGVEGPTAEPAILAARLADQRALLATLLLARGTPMLAMGAECGHSQGGNNNAYAQDGPISWLDWESADTGLTAFTAGLIAARQAHPALWRDHFLTGQDVQWRRPDGAAMADGDWATAATVTAVLGDGADAVALIFHASAETITVRLPAPAGGAWVRLVDSHAGQVGRLVLEGDAIVSRGVVMLVAGPAVAVRRGGALVT